MLKSLSIKMLTLTLGSFLLLLAGIILSMHIYFKQFYEPQKINSMINAINQFTDAYKNQNWTDETLYQEVSKFMKNQNASMSILATNGAAGARSVTLQASQAQMAIPNSLIIWQRLGVMPIEGKLAVTTKAVGPLTAHETSPGLIVSGGAGQATAFVQSPVQFDMGTSSRINDSLILFPVGVNSTVSVAGNIANLEKNGVRYVISDMPYTDFKQVDLFKDITLVNGETKQAFVNLSLQSVDEVTRALSRFYPFLIIFAVLLSVLIAFIYSKTVSRPIVKITHVANRMANMELGIKSDLSRKDELGDLSVSLNTLSSNLKGALDSLTIANQQLKKDYENEIRQEQARKEFVANVSHEIKTPLGVIKGYSEGIRDGVKSEKRDYYIEVILDEVDKMERLLLEMLEVSKYDAGAVVYNRRQTDLNALIAKAVEYFEGSLAEKELSISLEGSFGTACIDGDKLSRVLLNLIGNAVKYCTPNSTIVIRGEQVEGQTKIVIENDCEPLPVEALEKIWDRFYKVDTSHNRDKEGTGLGLAIAKSILEGHGCTYGVENTAAGVCFYFVVSST